MKFKRALVTLAMAATSLFSQPVEAKPAYGNDYCDANAVTSVQQVINRMEGYTQSETYLFDERIMTTNSLRVVHDSSYDVDNQLWITNTFFFDCNPTTGKVIATVVVQHLYSAISHRSMYYIYNDSNDWEGEAITKFEYEFLDVDHNEYQYGIRVR